MHLAHSPAALTDRRRTSGNQHRTSRIRGSYLSADQIVEVGGKTLKLTNLEKILYPAAGFTKGQVIDYYARIAPVLVPHLKDKPLTLKRYPSGVDQPFFFEKNATKHRPDWVKTAPVWSEGNQRDVNYILANNIETLIWTANLAGIELHPSLSEAITQCRAKYSLGRRESRLMTSPPNSCSWATT
jgi:hypothetical protein